MNECLFPGMLIDPPLTEGVKYAGSKLKLLPQILELANVTTYESVFDGFSGTTRVGQAFSQLGKVVHSNDRSVWSEVFGVCYLKNNKNRRHYSPLIDHLNAVKPKDGWYTENYGGIVSSVSQDNGVQPDGTKKPWLLKNTRKLDAIRDEIERLNLDYVEKCVALTSLILALDRVDNTLGHYAAYLKKWSARAHQDLVLKVPRVFNNRPENVVTKGDVFDSVGATKSDLAYFDPPYGSNNEKMPPSRVRYGAYYHLWTSVCNNDKPTLFGKVNRRVDTSDRVSGSIFEEFRRNSDGRFMAIAAIDKLIQITPCRWIMISYSSGGRATASELNEIIQSHGNLIKVVEVDYKKNVMAMMTSTNEWLREADKPNREFIFLMEK